MEGQTLYQCQVWYVLTASGLQTWEQTATEGLVGGERVAVNSAGGGKLAIDVPEGDATNLWHENRRDALIAAAEKVRSVAHTLNRQVYRLEAEAASCSE